MNQQEVGRPLSEAQKQHLTQLIANMRVARAKLDAANTILQAQVEMAQKEFDDAQGTANAFLRYCGNEHRVTFDDGQWGFDEQLMCFIRNLPEPEARPQLESLEEPQAASIATPAGVASKSVNGRIADAQNIT